MMTVCSGVAGICVTTVWLIDCYFVYERQKVLRLSTCSVEMASFMLLTSHYFLSSSHVLQIRQLYVRVFLFGLFDILSI